MEKTFGEPEENENLSSSEPITEMKDPLEEDVIHRPQSAGASGTGSSQPMPEYVITPDTGMGAEPPPLEPGAALGDDEDIPPFEQVRDEEKNMTPSQRKENALMTAEMLIELYGEGWRRGGNLLSTISERKIKKLKKDGQVILAIPISYQGHNMRIGQAIQVFNEISKDKIGGLNEKEKAAILPIIAEELEKRGWVMTKMMYAGMILAKHAIRQLKIAQKCAEQKNDFIKAIREHTAAVLKSGGYHTHQQTTPQQPTPPPPAEDTPATTVQTPPPPPPPDQMEETSGYTNAMDRTGAMMRNINRSNRRRAAAQMPAEKPKRKYIKRKKKASTETTETA